MLKVTVNSAESKLKSGTGKRSGKAYSFKEQSAWLHLPNKPFPVEIVLTLDDTAEPYPAGDYQLGPDSFYVGDFKRIECSPRLVRLAAAK